MERQPTYKTFSVCLCILQRRISDSIFSFKRYVGEVCRKNVYRLRNPQEAQQTDDSIYLVYTMGKVASMSVLNAITCRLPHVPVFAMHYMGEENLKMQEQQLGNSRHWDNRLFRKIHTQHAEKIRKCIAKYPHRHIKIVTLVREPLSQIISQIFQQLNLHDLEQLKRMTLDNRQISYAYPEEWCRNELQAFSGIDILAEPFSPEKGYEVYRNGRFSVLVMRFEDINRVFAEAMTAYSGVDRWTVGEHNKAENKDCAAAYRAFKDELVVEPAVLEKIYSSPFVNHFYTKKEVMNFRNQRNRPLTVWLTGLSGSGKSTIAGIVERKLLELNIRACVLDGDNLRRSLCSDLSFSPEDRSENIRRASEVARMMNDAGLVVVAAFISPYRKDREQAARIIGSRFVEVLIDANIETCKQRDPKGLYAKALAGEITGFTGIDAPYEKPENPDIHINTETLTATEAAMKIIEYICC